LTEEERQKVRNARNAKKKSKDKPNETSQQNPKRNVASVTGNVDGGDENEAKIDVHEGNVAQILCHKGIVSVSTDDAGDHMTSRRNTRARINAVHTVRHVPHRNGELSRSIL
jgi:hypothetical protein